MFSLNVNSHIPVPTRGLGAMTTFPLSFHISLFLPRL
jgi:hypothetical protein